MNSIGVHLRSGARNDRDMKCVDWAFGILGNLVDGEDLDKLLRHEVHPVLAEFLFWAAFEAYLTGGNIWKDAACKVVHKRATVSSIGRRAMSQALMSHEDEDLWRGCVIAEVLGSQTLLDENESARDTLIALIRTGSFRLRVSALQGIMLAPPVEALDAISECISDSSEDLQIRAAVALSVLGPVASGAISGLIARVDSPNREVRLWAITALARIASPARATTELLQALRGRLSDDDLMVRAAAVRAIGVLAPKDKSLVSDVITIWQHSDIDDWDPNDPVIGPTVACREELEHLIRMLVPRTGDGDFDDFVRRFLLTAFHPEARKHFEPLITHPWYQRVQTSQLLRRSPKLTYTPVKELMGDAMQEFALKLIDDPTLGMPPERWRELPGYIRNHASDIAKLLYRRVLRDSAGAFTVGDSPRSDFLHESGHSGPYEQAVLHELRQHFLSIVYNRMSPTERKLLRLRSIGGHTWEETASLVGTTVAQARYEFDKLLDKLAVELDISTDRRLLSSLPQFFGITECDGPSP